MFLSKELNGYDSIRDEIQLAWNKAQMSRPTKNQVIFVVALKTKDMQVSGRVVAIGSIGKGPAIKVRDSVTHEVTPIVIEDILQIDVALKKCQG